MKLFDEALTDAEIAVGLDPNYVKGHWRKGQALLMLNRPEEAEEDAETAYAMEPKNKQLESLLMDARKINTKRRLAGVWQGMMSSGMEQKLTFDEKEGMTMSVMGQNLACKYQISILGRPRTMLCSMVMPPGEGPPPPAMPYIFELRGEKLGDDEELWICQPLTDPDSGKMEIATKFEGPGFIKLRRIGDAPKPPEPTEPLDVRCAS